MSFALFIAGYALALPLGFRLAAIVDQQHRLGFIGHQTGVVLALIGWLSRGGYSIAAGHALWLVGTRIWFEFIGRRRRQATLDGVKTS